jgi:hypothetical protein
MEIVRTRESSLAALARSLIDRTVDGNSSTFPSPWRQFYDSKDFFHYKDLEKIAVKQKGVSEFAILGTTGPGFEDFDRN